MDILKIINPEMRGVFYGRHSTESQDMAAQKEKVKEYAVTHGLFITHYYEDEGVSARKRKITERPALIHLLEDATQGRFDYVLVYADDRLARNTKEHYIIRKKLSALSIPVILVTSGQTYDAGDVVTQTVKDSFTQYQASKIAADTKRTLEHIVRRGNWAGGNAPFGYKYIQPNDKKGDHSASYFEQQPEEIKLVKKVYALYRQNNLGFRQIARLITKEGTRRGKEWKPHNIKEIITNPFYAGYLTLKRRSLESRNSINRMITDWIQIPSDKIIPLMSLDEWKETWYLYVVRSTDSKQGYNNQFYVTNNIFKGIITCEHCGELLTCKDQRTERYNGEKIVEYGDNYYLCKQCKYKVPSEELHLKVKGPLWREIQKQFDGERVSEEIYNKFKSTLSDLSSLTDYLHNTVSNTQEGEDRAKGWFHELSRTNSGEKILSVVNLIKQGYQATSSRMQLYYKEQKYKLDYFLRDEESVKREINSFVNWIKNDHNSIAVYDFKKMLEFMLEELTINQDGKVRYAIRTNLLTY